MGISRALIGGTGLLCAAAWAMPAMAAAKVKPLVDARLRYEGVDQDGLPRDADAVTARLRLGAEIAAKSWSFLAEAEGTLAIAERYNSGLNGKAAYPIVADPETIELNRIQLQYRGLPGVVATVGRQRINLDDQRFVGSVGWRDNEQTFDAARAEWTVRKGTRLDVTYAWSDRTIWGIDGQGARPQAIGGDNVFVNLSQATPYGTLTGFAYVVDQDEARISGFRMSSQTYGARFAGTRALSKAARLNYALSYARQSDHHRNPQDYAADYYLVDAALDVSGFRIGAGYEVLGADDGRALTSFQTPLATLHKFQGWADKFLVTPPNGVRDLYGSVGYGWKSVGPFDSIGVSAVYHRFSADRGGQDYGDEIDLQALAKSGRFTFIAKYADYDADRFATDTRKAWLSVEWSY